MRAFSLAMGIGVLLVGATALAEPKPTEVEVINGAANPVPVVGQVEVMNPSVPARFQLVGFTSATYTGNLGGYFGAAIKCQVVFPGARMCTHTEAAMTTDIPSDLSGLAWVERLYGTVDFRLHDYAPTSFSNCMSWTNDLQGVGYQLSANGSLATIGSSMLATQCSSHLPIACCALR